MTCAIVRSLSHTHTQIVCSIVRRPPVSSKSFTRRSRACACGRRGKCRMNDRCHSVWGMRHKHRMAYLTVSIVLCARTSGPRTDHFSRYLCVRTRNIFMLVSNYNAIKYHLYPNKASVYAGFGWFVVRVHMLDFECVNALSH